MPLGTEVGLCPGRIVLHWCTSSPKGAQPSPLFGPCLLSKNAGWIKVPLVTEVGRGPSHIVLDGAHLPQKGVQQPPTFRVCLLCQTARWIKMPLSMEVGLDPGNIVLDWDSAPPQKKTKGCTTAPTFRPMSIVAKQLPFSATVEILFLIQFDTNIKQTTKVPPIHA